MATAHHKESNDHVSYPQQPTYPVPSAPGIYNIAPPQPLPQSHVSQFPQAIPINVVAPQVVSPYPVQGVHHQGHLPNGQVPVIVSRQMFQPMEDSYVAGYCRITAVCLGFLQIGLCCLSIGAAIIALIYEASRAEEGTGFWCGTVYAVVGSISLVAGFKPSNNVIIAVTVLSCMDIAFGITQLTLSVISLVDMIACWDEICVSMRPAAVMSTAIMGTYGLWVAVFGLCLLVIGCKAIFCTPKIQVTVVNREHPGASPSITTM